MALSTSKGLSKAQFTYLRKMFPYARPKVTDSIETIQRREGNEDVIKFIERELSDE